MNRPSTLCAILAFSLFPFAPAAAQSPGMDMKDMDMKMDKSHAAVAKKAAPRRIMAPARSSPSTPPGAP